MADMRTDINTKRAKTPKIKPTKPALKPRKRKKRSQASINKQYYDLYKGALDFYGIKTKPLKQPTKLSVKKLRTQYKSIVKQLKKKGYIDIPSIYDIKHILEEETAEEEDVKDIIDDGFIDLYNELKAVYEAIMKAEPFDYDRYKPNSSPVTRFVGDKNRIIEEIEFARKKVDNDYILLQTIMENQYFQEITQITYKYLVHPDDAKSATYYVENDLLELTKSIINDAMEKAIEEREKEKTQRIM